jgi:hypothetical protein
MAVWYAKVDGNISTSSMWSENAAGDPPLHSITEAGADTILCANGKSITIDTSFTCLRISTAVEGGAGGGGNFTCSATGIVITGDVYSGSTVCLTVTGGSITITGNVSTSAGASAYGIAMITGTSSVTINGNVTATLSAGLFINVSNFILNIGGNLQAGTATTVHGIQCPATTGTITINGNIIGGSGLNARGIYFSGSGSACVLTVKGNAQGGTNSTAAGIYSIGQSDIITVEGDVICGNGYQATGVFCNSSVRVKIKGNILTNDYGFGAIGRFCRMANATDSNYFQTYDESGNPIKMCKQLSAVQVLKGIIHGNIIGLLAAASPFRRINKRYV